MTTIAPSILSRMAMVGAVSLLVILSWLPVLDTVAKQHVEAGLTRSLTTFATARALNGVISLAQGTETAFQPAGVGVVLTPGQVLDPLNDLVERFSDLMLLASIAFGAEAILIEIGATRTIAVLITLMGGFWVVRHGLGRSVPSLLSRLLMILLVIRFAVPVTTVGSHWLFQQFMADRYTQSQQFLDQSTVDVENRATPAAEASPSWYDGLLPEQLNLSALKMPESPVEKIKDSLSAGIRHIVDMMVIFVLQVLVLPIAMLWMVYGALRRLIDP